MFLHPKILYKTMLLVLLLPAAALAAKVPPYVTDFFAGLHTLQADFE